MFGHSADLRNFDEWVASWALTLGGWPFATHAPDENRIVGVRIGPPPPVEGHHLFLRTRHAAMNADVTRVPRDRSVM